MTPKEAGLLKRLKNLQEIISKEREICYSACKCCQFQEKCEKAMREAEILIRKLMK